MLRNDYLCYTKHSLLYLSLSTTRTPRDSEDVSILQSCRRHHRITNSLKEDPTVWRFRNCPRWAPQSRGSRTVHVGPHSLGDHVLSTLGSTIWGSALSTLKDHTFSTLNPTIWRSRTINAVAHSLTLDPTVWRSRIYQARPPQSGGDLLSTLDPTVWRITYFPRWTPQSGGDLLSTLDPTAWRNTYFPRWTPQSGVTFYPPWTHGLKDHVIISSPFDVTSFLISYVTFILIKHWCSAELYCFIIQCPSS
jgi:hypothetical protein